MESNTSISVMVNSLVWQVMEGRGDGRERDSGKRDLREWREEGFEGRDGGKRGWREEGRGGKKGCREEGM